jgi:hypothetical protein
MLAREYALLLKDFRDQQLGLPVPRPVSKKDVERAANEELRPELDKDLWRLYRTAGKVSDKMTQAQFRATHNPMHWFVEFPEVMAHGGFDVIIGNPPYVEYSKVRKDYQIVGYRTESSGNLYAFVLEQCTAVLSPKAFMGLVVQQPIASTQRMQPVRDILTECSDVVLCSTFDDRPSKLFDGINHARIAIVLCRRSARKGSAPLYVTPYNKWYKDERPVLFEQIEYIQDDHFHVLHSYPKYGSQIEEAILRKMLRQTNCFAQWIVATASEYRLYYKITGVGHWFTVTSRPPRFLRDGEESASTREQSISFVDAAMRDRAFTALNSSLFYWFYQVRTNCRDFNPSDYKTFPIPDSLTSGDFTSLASRLQHALDESSSFISMTHSLTGAIQVEQFKPRLGKPIIDEIDRTLAQHYGLTDEELDFIINYDIKYRMGRGAEDEGEE